MAASVGADANGTATSWVQLARDNPVTIYRMIKTPMFVPLKIALCQTMATTTHAIKYAELTERCQDLGVSRTRTM
jgi:hypothetical protein